MIVRLKLFALAKDLAGTSSLELELPSGATVGELRDHLVGQLPQLAAIAPSVMFAIGDEYAADEAEIPADAEVALIPPVSGG